MFCTQCGADTAATHRFCAKCGNALELPTSGPVPESARKTAVIPSITPDKKICRGVGGWLLLLIAGMTCLGPLFGAGRIYADLNAMELTHPTLPTLDDWRNFRELSWWTFSIFSTISIFGGLGLALGHTQLVVQRAKISLWLAGPGLAIMLGIVVPIIAFGSESQVGLKTVGPLIGPLIGTTLGSYAWAAYLSKSKRVHATYGSPSTDTPNDSSGVAQCDASQSPANRKMSTSDFVVGMIVLLTLGMVIVSTL